jgi:hypothetical protein
MEVLKAENLEAWRVKYALEAEVAGVKAQLDGMARQGDSLHQVRCCAAAAADSSC